MSQIIVLNGAPRSGKSSIAAAVQATVSGRWTSLGVDALIAATPQDLLPGVGLRPGGERQDLEPFVAAGYSALFNQIATASLSGRKVVVDVGIHDGYSESLGVLQDFQQRLRGLPVMFVGVHCPLDEIRTRREATGYPSWGEGEPVPKSIQLWQDLVHADKTYDIEVDTAIHTPVECAEILRRLMVAGRPVAGRP